MGLSHPEGAWLSQRGAQVSLASSISGASHLHPAPSRARMAALPPSPTLRCVSPRMDTPRGAKSPGPAVREGAEPRGAGDKGGRGAGEAVTCHRP